jgi:lipid A 3-O-deacylase
MRIKTLIVALILGLCVLPVFAKEAGNEGLGTFWICWENDHFVQTDRGFTNGLKLTWITADKEMPGAKSWLDRQIFVLKPGFKHFRSYSLRQDMFTPDDLTEVELIEWGRPYAGYLEFELGAHSLSRFRAAYWGLSVGVVGPLSVAEHAQKLIHLSGRPDWPEGWQHQLKNELAVQLYSENKWRISLAGREKGPGLDIIPQVGGGLGNVYTYAHSGFQVRLGLNLPENFGTPLLRPGGSCGPGFSERDPDRAGRIYDSFYLFAVCDAQFVVRNIFLDGNTFRESHAVDKEALTGYLYIGLGAKVSIFHITFGLAAWSRLFKTQEKRLIYGLVNIFYSF